MKTPYLILKNINSEILDQKYNFSEYKEKNKEFINLQKTPSCIETDKKKTKLYDLKENHLLYYSTIDEAKSDNLCFVTMYDVLSNEKLPRETKLHCFHCRHSFQNIPLGCPIEYKNNKVYKNYYSEVTKNHYILQESVTEDNSNSTQEDSKFYQSETQKMSYYMTDGIFCSFNCCLSYIIQNKSNPLYKQSIFLLYKIYRDLFCIHNETSFEIKQAPDWRLLESYGGSLSIENYRKNFYKIEYKDQHEYLKNIPTFRSIGHVFQKKINL